MVIVLKVWSSDPESGLGFDYASVGTEITFLESALRRINVLCEQKDRDKSLDVMHYWDFSSQYFSLPVSQPSQPCDEASSKLEESIDALGIDMREAVMAVADFGIPEHCIGAVECAQMIVREEGIAFSALLKHSDTRVTTAEIPKQMIESALASART